MKTSIIENQNNNKILTSNFLVTKNIPLDKRFIASSISNIDIEIPVKRRYPGLLIFVVDSIQNDGTDNVYTGEYYLFTNDLSTPISLRKLLGRYDIKTVSPIETEGVYSYTDILVALNKTFAEAGSIRYIMSLSIAVIYDGTNWSYFSGKYTVNNELEYSTIPDILKYAGKLVYVTTIGKTKLILNDKTLSTIVVECTETPTNIQNYVYYNLNNYLHIGLSGILYKLQQLKTYSKTNLISGDNQIEHNLNSNNINCIFKINNEDVNNPFIDNGLVIYPSFTVVDENNIKIISNHAFTGTLFIQGISV